MKQQRKYSKNKKNLRFIEMASLREEIKDNTEDVFAEWIAEQDEANSKSNSNLTNHEGEGDDLSNRQQWLKSVEK